MLASDAGDGFLVRCTELDGGPRLRVRLRPEETRPAVGDRVTVVFRPEWVEPVASSAETAGGENLIPVTLVRAEFLGSRTECTFMTNGHPLRVELSSADLRRRPHLDEVRCLRVPADDLVWFASAG